MGAFGEKSEVCEYGLSKKRKALGSMRGGREAFLWGVVVCMVVHKAKASDMGSRPNYVA